MTIEAIRLPYDRAKLHYAEEPVKEAPEYMNCVVKNVQEEFVKVNLNDGGQE